MIIYFNFFYEILSKSLTLFTYIIKHTELDGYLKHAPSIIGGLMILRHWLDVSLLLCWSYWETRYNSSFCQALFQINIICMIQAISISQEVWFENLSWVLSVSYQVLFPQNIKFTKLSCMPSSPESQKFSTDFLWVITVNLKTIWINLWR